MKVKDVIQKLQEFNPDADVKVIDANSIAHEMKYDGYYSGGDCSESCKLDCEEVFFTYCEQNPENC